MSPGDLVRLLSGGPLMVVVRADVNGFEVLWFDTRNRANRAIVPAVALKRVK